ncbi:MAG: hypothetical protein WKG07_36035 [Hymenobacter sp.]
MVAVLRQTCDAACAAVEAVLGDGAGAGGARVPRRGHADARPGRRIPSAVPAGGRRSSSWPRPTGARPEVAALRDELRRQF